ncbi:MAG: hypothetical protein ACJ749_20325 [Flavisolibacter sp.]
MKKANLLFPTFSSLAEFVMKYRIKGAEVQAGQQLLTAFLTEEELVIASSCYGAVPRKVLHTFYSQLPQQ